MSNFGIKNKLPLHFFEQMVYNLAVLFYELILRTKFFYLSHLKYGNYMNLCTNFNLDLLEMSNFGIKN